MKKLFSLLAVFVMALSLNAQSNADLLQGQTYQMMQTMQREGVPQMTIAVGGLNANGPAVSPRNPSPPASAHRPAANNSGGGQQPGNPTTKIKGVEYFLTPCGPLLPGQICSQNGQDYVIDDDGNLVHIPTQPQAPNPHNNTGTATASASGVTVVSTIDDQFRKLDDGRIVATGNVRVVDPAGTSSATATASANGLPAGLFELDRTKDYYQVNPLTGKAELVEKPLMAQTVRRNQVLSNGTEVQLLERGREEHRLDDNFGLSTSPDSEHMPDPKVVAADHSGDAFTILQSGGGGFRSGGGFVQVGGGSSHYDATALYGGAVATGGRDWLTVGPGWMNACKPGPY